MPETHDGDKRTLITMKLTRRMLAELEREMRRTGQTRTALIRIAWQQYMDLRAAKKP